jgi:serine O-acetyltransferase
MTATQPRPGLFALIAEDLRTHGGNPLEPGFWAVAVHRCDERAGRVKSSIVRAPLLQLFSGLSTAIDWGFGIRVEREVKLGRRVRVWHQGGIHLAAHSIGNDVHLRPNTHFGPVRERSSNPEEWPTIGDGADIGAGACILGQVRVGAGAFVGANALITDDVPEGKLAIGVPGRVLPSASGPKSNEPPGTRLDKGRRDQNPPELDFFALLAEDFTTHGRRLSAPGFWAVAVHRFGNWRMGIEHKLLRAPFTLAYRTGFQLVRWLFGIELAYDVKLGRRVRLDHHGSITLGARSIGNDVVIHNGVATGVLRRGGGDDKPVIEDRVELGPRACIVGPVTVGHDTLVCANTVVPVSVPPCSTVLGVPGKLVNLERQLKAS